MENKKQDGKGQNVLTHQRTKAVPKGPEDALKKLLSKSADQATEIFKQRADK